MIRFEQNPNNRVHENPLKRLIAEIPYGVWHLRRTFNEKKKRRNSFEEAQGFLTIAQKALSEKNPYFSQNDNPKILNHLGTGFFASAYSFESNTGKWVIKLGASHSPMRTNFHPNTQEFAEWYQGCLDIQTQMFREHMPFLIPEPQTVLHIKGNQGEITIIIEPFVTDILSKKEMKSLSKEDKQSLRSEIDMFHEIYRQVGKGSGLIPDFELGAGLIRDTFHFVISKQHGEPHLVVLDNAPFDKEAPTPIFYQLNKLAGLMMVNTLKLQLRR